MTEPLVSWRTWAYRDDRIYSLRASSEKSDWTPGQIVKRNHFEHGIYSFKTMQESLEYMRWAYPKIWPFCFGEIYSWGKIIEHERGYHSEFAYPKKIYVLDNLIQNPNNLRRKYGCEVIHLSIDTYERWFYQHYLLATNPTAIVSAKDLFNCISKIIEDTKEYLNAKID